MLTYIDKFPVDGRAALAAVHHGKQLGEQPYIHPKAVIYDSHIGSWTDIGAECKFIESVFDDYSYAASGVWMLYSEVGKYASIAAHVRINPPNHPMQRVTQHHMTYRRKIYGLGETDDDDFFDWRRAHKCVVGHDVWIGHGATIMPGVTVGTGAVIGAGAIVTKDVAPYEVVVGVPARPIRTRFAEPVIAKLLQIAWWDWTREELESRFDDLNDIESFIAKYG